MENDAMIMFVDFGLKRPTSTSRGEICWHYLFYVVMLIFVSSVHDTCLIHFLTVSFFKYSEPMAVVIQ